MSDFITKSIKGILMNGIQLSLESEEEEEYYLINMHQYFEEETDYPAYLRSKKVLEIETMDMQVAMEITIQHSTLYLLPYSSDVFDIFTEVLKFISARHTEIIKELRGSEEIRIESLNEINKKVEDEKTTEDVAEEPSSDDDFEWI